MLALLSQFYTICTDYKPLNGERTLLYSAISRCQYPIGGGILPVKQSVKMDVVIPAIDFISCFLPGYFNVFSAPRIAYGMLDGRLTVTNVLERMLKEAIGALD